MNADDPWFTCAQLQAKARYAPATPWGFAVSDALDAAIEAIADGEPPDENQVKNLIVNRTRKHCRRQALLMGSTTYGPCPVQGGLDARIDTMKQLQRCSDSEKVILLARAFGFSVSEIGTMQGVPAGTIKTWTYRARQKLAA